MKKTIILVILFTCLVKVCFSQNSTAAKVTIGTSYVTIGLVNVHPYLSGATPKSDDQFNFKLNIGTKFKINEVISGSDGSISGYVIVPWNFSNDTAKQHFYNNFLKANSIKRQEKILQDSINAKKASLQSLQAQITRDSLTKLEKKAKYDSLQRAVIVHQTNAFTNAVNIILNPKTVKKAKNDPILKQQVTQFVKAQDELKHQIKKGISPDSTARQTFIEAAKKLPSANPTLLQKYTLETTNYQNNLREADKDYRATLDQLTGNRGDLIDKQNELNGLVNLFGPSHGQSNNQSTDSNAYKVKKADKNIPLDASTDTTDQASKYEDLAFVDSWANGWEFFISAKDFTSYAVLIYPKSDKFTWGFLTLPVKMRFDNSKMGRFNFEQNLNFGLTFGDKHQFVSTSDVSLNTLVGLDVVNVPLNNATATTSASSTTAVSTSIGVMLQYDKFQMGVFLGTDFAGAHANQFDYQGKPWLGFAIGVSLFGESQTTSTSQSQNSGKP